MQLLNSLLATLFLSLSLTDGVHRLAHQHLDLVGLGPQFLHCVLQSILEEVFLVQGLAEFSLQADLHRLLQSLVHLLEVEYLILELLVLVEISEALGVLLHLAGRLRMLVDESDFESLLLFFKAQYAGVDICDLFLGQEDLFVALLDLRLQGLEVTLILLLDLPVLELASSLASAAFLRRSDALADAASDLAARLCRGVEVGGQGLASLSLSDALDELSDVEMARTIGNSRLSQVAFVEVLDLGISHGDRELFQGSLELDLVELTLPLPVILRELSLEVESLIRDRLGESAQLDLRLGLLGQLEQLLMED